MKPKRTLSGYALLVGILSLSIVGGALIYGIYSSLVKTQVTTATQTLIRPLDGQIDPTTLDSLESRRKFTAGELAAQIAPTPTATEEAVVASPEPEQVPEITPEAEISPTEEISQP